MLYFSQFLCYNVIGFVFNWQNLIILLVKERILYYERGFSLMKKPNEAIRPVEAVNSERKTEFPRKQIAKLVKSGKVRNIHAFNGLIFETSNRLSVFDRVIKEDVPKKGAMLNCINKHNKNILNDLGYKTDDIPVSNSFFEAVGFDSEEDINRLSYAEALYMLPFEFIVRGYLVGSAYKAYSEGQSYCGITFPDGLKEGDRLPEPVVTVTTKEQNGHDRPITKEECIDYLASYLLENFNIQEIDDICRYYNGDYDDTTDANADSDSYTIMYDNNYLHNAYSIACFEAKEFIDEAYDISLKVFSILSQIAEAAGILFIDTKFEFGINGQGDLILADEVGTPDSSRFASAEEYASTGKIVSMDKQIVRDYCTSIGFNGDPDQPIPKIPDEIWERVTETYVHIAELLCGAEAWEYL